MQTETTRTEIDLHHSEEYKGWDIKIHRIDHPTNGTVYQWSAEQFHGESTDIITTHRSLSWEHKRCTDSILTARTFIDGVVPADTPVYRQKRIMCDECGILTFDTWTDGTKKTHGNGMFLHTTMCSACWGKFKISHRSKCMNCSAPRFQCSC